MDFSCTFDQSLITRLIPHRPPFLMVDTILYFRGGKFPSVKASYTTSDTDIFCNTGNCDEHWPSMHVMEGMGQACNLMIIISMIEKELLKAGYLIENMKEVLNGLINNESDDVSRALKSSLDHLAMGTYSNVGFLGSADMEITGYAKRGQKVIYEIEQSQMFGSLFYSNVKAFSGNRQIAGGTLVSAALKN
jgi:3-hydroxymyristoyl/3-hydroxydecanoyl-(acyl carrier protein) dehydratase